MKKYVHTSCVIPSIHQLMTMVMKNEEDNNERKQKNVQKSKTGIKGIVDEAIEHAREDAKRHAYKFEQAIKYLREDIKKHVYKFEQLIWGLTSDVLLVTTNQQETPKQMMIIKNRQDEILISGNNKDEMMINGHDEDENNV